MKTMLTSTVDAIYTVADLMTAAALTAPKTSGQDKIVTLILNGDEKKELSQGLIVIRYYLALRGAENGVTAMVTPFFCVQG